MQDEKNPTLDGVSGLMGGLFVTAGRGTVGFSLQNLINIILGIVFVSILARAITPDELGILLPITFLFMLFQTVALMGLQNAAARYVALYKGEGRNPKPIVTGILHISIISGSILSLGLYLASPLLASFLIGDEAYSYLVKWASLAVISYVLGFSIDGLLQGMQMYRNLAIIRVIAQAVKVSAGLALLMLGVGVLSAIAGEIVWGIALSSISLTIIFKKLKRADHSIPYKDLVTYAFPLMLSYLLIFTSNWIDSFLVVIYLSLKEWASYFIVMKITFNLYTFALTTIVATVLPTLSYVYGHRDDLRLATNRALKIQTLIYSPIVLVTMALSEPAVIIIAGESYLGAVIPVAIIAGASAFYGIALSTASFLQAVGLTRRVLYVTLFSVIVDIILTISLIPYLGIIGASIGRAGLFLTSFMLMNLETKKVLGKLKMVPNYLILVAATIASGIAYSSWSLIPSYLEFLDVISPLTVNIPLSFNIIVTVIVSLLLATLSYALLLRLFKVMSDEELQILRNILPNKLRWIINIIGS